MAHTTADGEAPRNARRLLVVSHPAVVAVNQEPYRELAGRGWDVSLVVPSRWRHAFSRRPVRPHALPGLERALLPRPVAFAGRPQRYFFLTRCRRLCALSDPAVVFVEAEPFSLVATQWRRVCQALGVPFGVQCAENIDRSLPRAVRALRAQVLTEAAFVAARSLSAASLARAWGARGEVALAPHAVPRWQPPPAGEQTERPFTVGYAGRLVQSKGLLDLLAAVRMLAGPVQLLLVGDGELRGALEGEAIPGSRVRVLDGYAHEQMAEAYAQLDVLVLPSRTTPNWKEQFGRTIVEALWCGVPVVGSDSGEIPWLIELTGGGLVFPEGDVAALAQRLARLREEPQLRRELAQKGAAAVQRNFSLEAATDSLERLLEHAAAR
jgi:glycosyltransferase involved in cell wall biosynthesis